MLHKAVPLSGNMAGVTVHAHNTTSCLLLFFGHPSFSPHPVSLYPEGASAAQWALKLKTEQIKVTVGGLGGSQRPATRSAEVAFVLVFANTFTFQSVARLRRGLWSNGCCPTC